MNEDGCECSVFAGANADAFCYYREAHTLLLIIDAVSVW